MKAIFSEVESTTVQRKYANTHHFSKVGGNYPMDLKIIWSSGFVLKTFVASYIRIIFVHGGDATLRFALVYWVQNVVTIAYFFI
jgi:hypothetical protein